MPLETGGPTFYIDGLNDAWPLGTDTPDAGDNHLRLIKQALLNTFPNITGPVTLDQDDINGGYLGIPSGTKMVFYQAAAPVGWTRTAISATLTNMLRVVVDGDPGATSGGTDNPILNDKVPSHTHTVNLTSATESASHTHFVSGATGQETKAHTHTGGTTFNLFERSVAAGGDYTVAGINIALPQTGTVLTNEEQPADYHTHNFSATTFNASVSHTHAVSGSTAANASAANWAPRYLDVIICTKD